MRIFLTRGVERFARQQRIADASLGEAIERAKRGIIDADLGGVWREVTMSEWIAEEKNLI